MPTPRKSPPGRPAPKSASQQRLRDAQRQYIRRALQLDPDKRTLTEIARSGGIDPSTLTRFMNDPGHEGVLSSLTIRRFAEVTGVPPTSGIAGPAVTGMAEEAEPFILEAAEPDLAEIVRVLLRGRNGADPWILKTAMLDSVGYYSGDLVILDSNAVPRPGDTVCAQVYDWRRGKAETVWRVFNPPYLMAPGRHNVMQKPLVVDNDRVAIKGVITDCLRQRPASLTLQGDPAEPIRQAEVTVARGIRR